MRYLLVTLILLTLSACGPEPKYPTPKGKPRESLDIKVLGYAELDNIGGIRILCIDGIRYLHFEHGGITPKYTAWQDADPTVEECE